MNILCVDTSYDGCSLALKTRKHLSTRILPLPTNTLTTTLSTELVPLIVDMCEEAGIALGEVTHIITTTGPASFTGLRITLSTLQGIVLATKAKVLTITRLYLLAHMWMDASTHEKEVFLDNHKDGYFRQMFVREKPSSLPAPTSDVEVVLKTTVDAIIPLPPSSDSLALKLLDFAKENNTPWEGIETLIPFYGHTPVFKKRAG